MTSRLYDICVIGLGPAGLGFATQCAQQYPSKSIIALDRGTPANTRVCTVLQRKGCRYVPHCEVGAGLGGLAVLAGGKISFLPAGRNLINEAGDTSMVQDSLQHSFSVLSRYVPLTPDTHTPDELDHQSEAFANKGFQLRYYPAYKYNAIDMIAGITSMEHELTAAGIEIRTSMDVTSVRPNSRDTAFEIHCTTAGGRSCSIQAKNLVLAMGRSGSQLLRDLQTRGLKISYRPQMDIGYRLEFPAAAWPDIDACHNDLKLFFENARTFCTCKDGWIAPYRNQDLFLIEGKANSRERSGFTNLAITQRVESNPRQLTAYVRNVTRLSPNRYMPMGQTYFDYSRREISATNPRSHPSTFTYWRWGDLATLYPSRLDQGIRSSIHYFVQNLLPDSASNVTLYGPELDYYWPRVDTGKPFTTNMPSVYAIGDVIGKYRGIAQAFASGILLANSMLDDRA